MGIATIMGENTLNDFALGLILEVDRVNLGNLLKKLKIQVEFYCGSGKMAVRSLNHEHAREIATKQRREMNDVFDGGLFMLEGKRFRQKYRLNKPVGINYFKGRVRTLGA